MKPRVEQKLRVEPHELADLYLWISRHGGGQLHPDRKVTSTYFDTQDLLMYRQTDEGITPRKKLRIRCYGNHPADCAAEHNLEIKITTEFTRLKETRACSDWRSLIASGIHDVDYGWCFPQTVVSYQRSYYSMLDVRLTIDRFLSYRRPPGAGAFAQKVEDPAIAVEIKAPADSDLDVLANDFPLSRWHFSKFERSIDALFVRP